MSVRFNSSDSVPFVTTCDFDGFLNTAGVEAVGEREVGARWFIDAVQACLPSAVRFVFFSIRLLEIIFMHS